METKFTIEFIAETCHEINRTWCELNGDFTQPKWKDAPEWQKQSAINGVKFHLNNPNSTPESSHINWLKEKQEQGWKYGPVKNPDLKEHPCFKPYNELPIEQRIKDSFFISTIHNLTI
jgi:hypothetical protein